MCRKAFAVCCASETSSYDTNQRQTDNGPLFSTLRMNNCYSRVQDKLTQTHACASSEQHDGFEWERNLYCIERARAYIWRWKTFAIENTEVPVKYSNRFYCEPGNISYSSFQVIRLRRNWRRPKWSIQFGSENGLIQYKILALDGGDRAYFECIRMCLGQIFTSQTN